VYLNLLGQKLKEKVTKNATVTPAEEKDYYDANLGQYNTPASTTRSVEYILFKCAEAPATSCSAAKSRAEKTKADKVEQKLKNGASFEAMARQYSDDTTTAPLGGKFTLDKDHVVPAFAAAGLALKTGNFTQQPVDATSVANQGFGWFIIKALGPTKTTKARTLSFKDVEPTIKSYLLQQKQSTAFQQWITDLAKQYQGKVSYQAGLAPPPTTTTVPTGITTG
jgi:parvulin-like peptidyl-prolyl isomerase